MFGDTSYQPDPTLRRQAVGQLTERIGYAAAALTLIPLPGTEIVGVMPLHVAMVMSIGELHGKPLSRDGALELVAKIGVAAGVSIVGSRIATTAAKTFLPFLGGLISAPFMFASTLAIGAVADAWFEREGSISPDDMRDLYSRTQKKAKSEYDADKARSDEARSMAEEAAREEAAPKPAPAPGPVERLGKLKALLDAGLIDQAEFDATKARILGDL